MRIRMTADLHVETINDEILVADPLTDTVVRLSGEAAGVVQTLLADGETDVAEGDVLNGLLAHGVVEPMDAGSLSLSRRKLIGTAAALTGIGIAAMAMPSPAAAASPAPPDPIPFEVQDINALRTGASALTQVGSVAFLWQHDDGAGTRTDVTFNYTITRSWTTSITNSASGSASVIVGEWAANRATGVVTATMTSGALTYGPITVTPVNGWL